MRLLAFLVLIISAAAATPDGAAIFDSHCATCHQTETGSRVPTRAELANLTPEQVMSALLRGKMTIQGSVLATSEVRAVALYVTGKNWSAQQVDPAAGLCSATPKPFSPGSSDWNGWGVDSSNARYQPRPGFQAADAPRLKLKWAFGFPDDTQAAGQPVVVSGRVFVGSNGGIVYSLDASSGCVYWSLRRGRHRPLGHQHRQISEVIPPENIAMDRIFRRLTRLRSCRGCGDGKAAVEGEGRRSSRRAHHRLTHLSRRPAVRSRVVIRRAGRRIAPVSMLHLSRQLECRWTPKPAA